MADEGDGVGVLGQAFLIAAAFARPIDTSVNDGDSQPCKVVCCAAQRRKAVALSLRSSGYIRVNAIRLWSSMATKRYSQPMLYPTDAAAAHGVNAVTARKWLARSAGQVIPAGEDTAQHSYGCSSGIRAMSWTGVLANASLSKPLRVNTRNNLSNLHI
jgi:hypothetical protein